MGLQSKALTSFLQMREESIGSRIGEAMQVNPLFVPARIVVLRAHVWRRGVGIYAVSPIASSSAAL
jgi:hypothetical protein